MRENDEEDFDDPVEEESFVETLGRLMDWDKNKNKNPRICEPPQQTPPSS